MQNNSENNDDDDSDNSYLPCSKYSYKHLILTTTLWEDSIVLHYLIDEETEAHRFHNQ